MSILERYRGIIERMPIKNGFKANSLNAKLTFWVIPPVMVIIMITGYITYMISYQFIGMALERSVKLQTRAMAHDIELTLAQYRRDLLFLAQNPGGIARYGEVLARLARTGGVEYRAIGFIAQSGAGHMYWVAEKGRTIQIPGEQIAQLRPDPFVLMDSFRELGPGEVWISPIFEAQFLFPTPENPNRKIMAHVILLATPVWPEGDPLTGFALLAVDVSHIRNILSIYNSSQSPIWSYPRTAEVRYSYLFDLDGWILFQSEEPDKPEVALSTYLARTGLEGTLGRPGLPGAFRPAARYGYFWKMVREARDGHFGLKRPADPGDLPLGQKEHYLAYSPIRFTASMEKPPAVYAGLAYVDISRLIMAAGYKQVDVIFLLTMAAAVLVALLIFFLGRTITGPMLRLAREVQTIQQTGRLEPIALTAGGQEMGVLQSAINRMVGTLKAQMEEIRVKDQVIHRATMKEVAWEMDEASTARVSSDDPTPQLLGTGPLFEALRKEILKASQVDVDVLVLGETGTGKELTAEAIHRLSRRTSRPFIAINCGALDENLLLDTLFGHTRGAFTEARTDRKGAFLEADGGTLFLDEIQAASPRVQQALLRALAARCIKPLGSDRDISVDVRIIAASNVDLKALIARRKFREDLYFRLKVITIETPALRHHKEDIPLLARHFLQETAGLRGIQGLVLSRGALEKLQQYVWPGNVRELKHCMVRAAVMAEASVIQAQDIRIESGAVGATDGAEAPEEIAFGSEAPPGMAAPADRWTGGDDRAAPGPADGTGAEKTENVRLNSRQMRVLPIIRANGQITRSQYQRLAGEVPPRTAVYDLNDLVRKGLLARVGRGPATRYVLLETGPGDSDPGGGFS